MVDNIDKTERLSLCCLAPVRMEGVPDFIGDTEICTGTFVCSACGEPCDTILLAGVKLLPLQSIKRMAEIMLENVESHGLDTWRTLDKEYLIKKARRHDAIADIIGGPLIDGEGPIEHRIHAAIEQMMAAEVMMGEKQ